MKMSSYFLYDVCLIGLSRYYLKLSEHVKHLLSVVK